MYNNGKNVRLQFAVICAYIRRSSGFQWNVIDSVPKIRVAYCILTNHTKLQAISYTIICICCAHMIKAFAKRLTRVEKDKDRRRTVTVMFAALQRCPDLLKGKEMFKDIATVLRTHTKSQTISSTYDRVMPFVSPSTQQTIVGDDETFDRDAADFDGNVFDEICEETKLSLKEQSPFTAYFCAQLTDTDDETETDSNEETIGMFSPSSFKEIRSIIHLWPL